MWVAGGWAGAQPAAAWCIVQEGDSLPDIKLDQLEDGEIKQVSLKQLFSNKKGILFGVPGAFTPGCSKVGGGWGAGGGGMDRCFVVIIWARYLCPGMTPLYPPPHTHTRARTRARAPTPHTTLPTAPSADAPAWVCGGS